MTLFCIDTVDPVAGKRQLGRWLCWGLIGTVALIQAGCASKGRCLEYTTVTRQVMTCDQYRNNMCAMSSFKSVPTRVCAVYEKKDGELVDNRPR